MNQSGAAEATKATKDMGVWVIIYRGSDQKTYIQESAEKKAAERIVGDITGNGGELISVYRGAKRVQAKTKVTF